MAIARELTVPGSVSRERSRRHPFWRETTLARISLGAVVLYLLDDAFLHPEEGVSRGDHLISGTVPLIALALVAIIYPRLHAALRGWLTLGLGLLTVGTGVAVPVAHGLGDGPSGDDFTGLVATLAGLFLVFFGVATLWRTRRTNQSRLRRYARRALIGIAAFYALVELFILPIGFAYRATHVPRASVTPVDLGVPYQEVTFTTSDGLHLAGWYVPSRNGAGKWLQLPMWLTMTTATAVLANTAPPPSLIDLVAQIAPRPVFLIYATHGQGGEELNPRYYAAAGEPKELWEIPEAGHTGGIDARPEEYEQRVIAFFDHALLKISTDTDR